jgi:hypothetical protein
MKTKIIIITLFVLVVSGSLIFLTRQEKGKIYSPSAKIISDLKTKFSQYPECPADLTGILTAPLIELKYISALTPLGNLNPPGHTSPVDHIYFSTDSETKIPIYAPADSWITNIITVAFDRGHGFEPYGYVVQFTVCNGLVLDFANINDISQTLKNEIANQKGDCYDGPQKMGHDGPERQCSYSINLKISSGEQVGYVQRTKKSDGNFDFPFEIWAADYNKPAPSNIDWSYYDNDDRYAHIMCPFDLYAGILKQQFYDKLGGVNQLMNKDEKTGKQLGATSVFKRRIIEPICGTVNQNLVGTIQGMWFGEGWQNRKDKSMSDNIKQFSFLHWNIDPTYTAIGNAGEITSGRSGQLQFIANHSGTIDREPSEVKADGQVYCYKYNVAENGQIAQEGKILVQLIDDRHLKLEYKTGFCGTTETFVKSYSYER